MRSAYLNQVVNLLVAILMVPLLLRYLDINGFILWSIFTTFGGITLQIESAIQIVSVREIAKEYHSGSIVTIQAAVRKARVAYATLSACVLIPFLMLGLLYLNYIATEKLGTSASIEWLIFISAYALNYYFGTNNSVLLGMAHVALYNNINSLTRLINLSCTYALLKSGFSVMGICLSFVFSVIIGCVLISRAATQSLENYRSSQDALVLINTNANFELANSSNILKYTFYMFSAFVLYKGGLLVATMIFPKEVIGAYGLSLQANTMLSMLALVPVQVWLHRLVRAIASGDRKEIFHELAVSIVAANTVFIAGEVVLAIFGNALLVLIGSKVVLVGDVDLFLIGLSFLVEMNIFLLVNFLVVTRNYGFVKIYVTTSLIGVVLAIFLTWITKDSVATLIIVPLGLQALLCLPLILRIICRELSVTPMNFLIHIYRFICIRT